MEYQFIISGEIGVAFDWWTGQRGTTANQVKNFLDAHKDEDVHIAVCSPGGYVDAPDFVNASPYLIRGQVQIA